MTDSEFREALQHLTPELLRDTLQSAQMVISVNGDPNRIEYETNWDWAVDDLANRLIEARAEAKT